jgi:prepilin-type N-terminal cleavage/methylation domain-containing protein
MRRRGLSLVEVLIAVVLLGIVGAGITRLLQSQMRYFTRTTNQKEARSVARSALNLMRAEMRMIDPLGLVDASADSVRVRLPYATGVHCSAGVGTFAPVDSMTLATAVYAGYAWKDTAATATYTYVSSATAPVAGLATTCALAGLGTVPGGPIWNIGATPTTVAGAPLVLYQIVTYRIAESVLLPGRTAVWREALGGTAEEIAVPFGAGTRFRFYIAGANIAQDAVPSPVTSMTGLELVLVGESERISPGTAVPESRESRVAIFFRNAVQ